MSVGKVTFRGVEAPQPQPQTPEQTKVSFQGQEVDEEKSNAAKYMIGAAALAGVVALGIAGYKGHLGEGVQKFLGGAKKAAEKEGSKAAESSTSAASGSAAKAEKYTAEELSAMSKKNISELSDDEMKKLITTITPDDEPVFSLFFQKALSSVPKEGRKNKSVEKFVRQFSIIRKFMDRNASPEEIAHNKYMLGKDSPLLKKINDLTIKDYIDISKIKGFKTSEEELNTLSMLNPEMKFVEFNKEAKIFPESFDFETSIMDNISKIMA